MEGQEDVLEESSAAVYDCVLDMDLKWCKTHEIELAESKLKTREWKLCYNGLYRNVYKTNRTFTCPRKSRILMKPNEALGGKSEQKIKSSPKELFSIFIKRKR